MGNANTRRHSGMSEFRGFILRVSRKLQAKVVLEKKKRACNPHQNDDGQDIIGLVVGVRDDRRIVATMWGRNCRQEVVIIIDHLHPKKREEVHRLVDRYSLT